MEFLEFFMPSGQLPLRLFVVPEPLERNMDCTQGELVTKKVVKYTTASTSLYVMQYWHFSLLRAWLA